MATKETLSSAELDALLSELESKLQRLKTIYEQYFLGIERTPPHTLRKDVFRIVQRLENLFIRSTAQKFRMRSLVQRFNTYKTYWARIERQIEEGTYQRDINRANRRSVANRSDRGDDNIIEIDLEEEVDLQELQLEMEEMDAAGAFDNIDRPKERQISDEDREALKRAKLEEIKRQLMGGALSEPAPTPAASAPSSAEDERQAKLERLKQRLGPRGVALPDENEPERPAPVSKQDKLAAIRDRIQESKGTERVIERPISSNQTRTIQRNTPSDDPARRVFDELIETKKKLNESTAGLTYESVKSSMNAQTEQLKKAKGAKEVDFKVVVKDGKAFLKPTTK